MRNTIWTFLNTFSYLAQGHNFSRVNGYCNFYLVFIFQITSLVIASFGANTLLLFQQENDEFQKQKEMIFCKFYIKNRPLIHNIFTYKSIY